MRFGRGRDGKVTAISVFADGAAVRRDEVTAGQIARLSGLAGIQIGDAIGTAPDDADRHYFAPPTLETAMVARDPRDKPRLHAAITELAEQDPLINVRQDDIRQEIYVSLYGEVQKQVIEATLATEYGIEIGFRETTPICVERPVRSGTAEEILNAPGNPFLATLRIRIDPAPAGPAPAPPSGSRSATSPSRCTSTRTPRTSPPPWSSTCRKRCARAFTAGRSPTARCR